MLGSGGKSRRGRLGSRRDAMSKAEAARIGGVIRKFRTEREWTQADLAARLRCTPSAVGSAERGIGLTRERLGRLAAAFNVRITLLTAGSLDNHSAEVQRPQTFGRRRQNQDRRFMRVRRPIGGRRNNLSANRHFRIKSSGRTMAGQKRKPATASPTSQQSPSPRQARRRPERLSRLRAKEARRRLTATGLTIPKGLPKQAALGVVTNKPTNQSDTEAALRSLGWHRRPDRTWAKGRASTSPRRHAAPA
jgi:transcriptional regulator with XRE-family HTH domain